MKQTNFFNISVPELGDRPDITQVSNAISNLEDALAGTMEYMNASVNNKVLTLTSATRKTKRTGYHTGLTCVFTSGVKIDIGGITSVIVDNLPARPAELKFIIDADDSAIVVFDGTKFAFKHAPMPRSNAIDSSSEHFIATSRAVKTLNDNKAEKTVQVIAGNGLTGGGDLTSNKTINVVSADAGIVVNADNIKLNVVNAVNSTDAIRPATANAVKTAYDKGVEGLNKANEAVSLANSNNTAMDNKKVNRAGDTMTGRLVAKELQISGTEPGIMNSAGGNLIRNSSSDANITVVGNIKGKTIIDSLSNPAVRVGSTTTEQTIYHTGNKPSKADVGLSSVPNYPATSSVSDTSNEKFATAGAVKQAYDRASSGINEANTKVSKAGDTMTGTLVAPSFTANSQAGLKFANIGTGSGGYIGGHPTIGIGFVNLAGNSWNFNVKDNGDANIKGTATATKFLGPLQGNADTATKLATARQINGTNFDGTANITTANWGTARNITIGNTTKSVNGSGNVSFSASEIGYTPLKTLAEQVDSGFYFGQVRSGNTAGAPTSGSQAFILKGDTGTNAYEGALVWGYTNNVFSLGQKSSGGSWEWKRVYHEGFKPTKADVSLGSVNNWTATSAVNDSSNSKYATAGAVKTAYDLANTAKNTADGAVKKSGDAMTGQLNINQNNLLLQPNVTMFSGLQTVSSTKTPELFTTRNTVMPNNSQAKVRLMCQSTGGPTGSNWIVSSDKDGNKTVVSIGKMGDSSNHPLLKVDGTKVILYTNHANDYTILTEVELYNGGGPLQPFVSELQTYGVYNKPTKADVGLSNVINHASVNRAGDTMTGDLFLKKGSPIIRLNDSRSTTANTGYIGFGSSTVDTLQIINSAKNAALNISDTFSFSKGLSVSGGATFSADVYFSQCGNMRIGGASGWFGITNTANNAWVHRFNSDGSYVANGNITAYSDIKLKEDLEVIPDALNKIGKLNGYTYTRKDSGERHSGVVAQEVQAVLPEVVIENKGENDEVTLGVAYGNMVGLLIEGIKELRAENKALAERLAKLEAKYYGA